LSELGFTDDMLIETASLEDHDDDAEEGEEAEP